MISVTTKCNAWKVIYIVMHLSRQKYVSKWADFQHVLERPFTYITWSYYKHSGRKHFAPISFSKELSDPISCIVGSEATTNAEQILKRNPKEKVCRWTLHPLNDNSAVGYSCIFTSSKLLSWPVHLYSTVCISNFKISKKNPDDFTIITIALCSRMLLWVTVAYINTRQTFITYLKYFLISLKFQRNVGVWQMK